MKVIFPIRSDSGGGFVFFVRGMGKANKKQFDALAVPSEVAKASDWAFLLGLDCFDGFCRCSDPTLLFTVTRSLTDLGWRLVEDGSPTPSSGT